MLLCHLPSPAVSLGFTILVWDFCVYHFLVQPLRYSHYTFVDVACQSFESVRWNACVHRLDLSLHSHPKEFWGNGVKTNVNSMGKIPSTRKIHPRRIEPKPQNQTGEWGQHTTIYQWAIPAPKRIWFFLDSTKPITNNFTAQRTCRTQDKKVLKE